MPHDLDDQPVQERAMDYVRQVRLSTGMPVGFTAGEPPRERRANRRGRQIDSRIVLGACAILLSVVGVSASMKALELRPPSACLALPVHLILGAETAARIETSSGIACTVSVQTGSAVIDDLTVTSPAQHGSVAPRGRTGVIYRPQGNYQGEDQFELALRGRSDAKAGVAIVRVRVTVQ